MAVGKMEDKIIINTIIPKAQLPKYRRDMKESAGETQYGDVMARTQ